MNLSLQITRNNKIEKLYLGPKLNAGGKASIRFPPKGLVKLAVDQVSAYTYKTGTFVKKNKHVLLLSFSREMCQKQCAVIIDRL